MESKKDLRDYEYPDDHPVVFWLSIIWTVIMLGGLAVGVIGIIVAVVRAVM